MGGGFFGFVSFFLSYIHDCILHGHMWRFFLRFFSNRLIGLVELFI